jgi:hypothetical protein
VSDDERSFPRHQLGGDDHESFSFHDMSRDVDAIGMRRTQKDRGMWIARLVDRELGSIVRVDRNVDVFDRGRSTPVAKNTLLLWDFDESADPFVFDCFGRSDDARGSGS